MKKYNIIYGYKNVKNLLLTNYKKIYKIYTIKKYLSYNIFNLIKSKKINYKIKSKKFINNIFYKKTDNILAYINTIKYFKIKKVINNILKTKKLMTILIINKLYDYNNFGNIIRTSVLFNVNTIIIPKNFFFINENMIYKSVGYFFKIPICKVNNLLKCIKYLKKKKILIYSISNKFNNIYSNKCNFNKNLCIILGNEHFGINKLILNISDKIIKIPMNNNKSSLNVATSCGIILYEIFLQKLK
ncbi:MAG: TrmH family RNA methyltransferase [Candidatus Shikimatogenerans sp. AspAUS03]|uniref:TrmH family RNA methyltransferase n=1 Tax=Candidatus Shikimatogenerans sp. AspAUS03 TaxID=3158563 RepID=A0AAU7QSI2_9FLAO